MKWSNVKYNFVIHNAVFALTYTAEDNRTNHVKSSSGKYRLISSNSVHEPSKLIASFAGVLAIERMESHLQRASIPKHSCLMWPKNCLMASQVKTR